MTDHKGKLSPLLKQLPASPLPKAKVPISLTLKVAVTWTLHPALVSPVPGTVTRKWWKPPRNR